MSESLPPVMLRGNMTYREDRKEIKAVAMRKQSENSVFSKNFGKSVLLFRLTRNLYYGRNVVKLSVVL